MDLSLRQFSLPSPSSPSNTGSLGNAKRSNKSHVPTACVNCKKAHLACDLARPCRRCVSVGKMDTCFDIQHKKRGRPKLRDKRILSTPSRQGGPEHSSSPLSIAVAPVVAPGLVDSSFSMTQPPGYQYAEDTAAADRHMMTLFLSMDLRCARVSDESLEFFGLYPQELAHRSLYDFIAPDSAATMARIHRCLTESVPRQNTHEPTTSERFVTVSPSTLLGIANGSQTLKETLAIIRLDGVREHFDARFYLGGGLGADLFAPDATCHVYMVCLLTHHKDRPKPITHTHTQQTQHTQHAHSHRPSLSFPENTSPSLSSCSSSTNASILNHSSIGFLDISPSSSLVDDHNIIPTSGTSSDLFLERALSIPHSAPGVSIGSLHAAPSSGHDSHAVTLANPWTSNQPPPPQPLPLPPTTQDARLPNSSILPLDESLSINEDKVSRSALAESARLSHPNTATTSMSGHSNLVWMQPHDVYYTAPSPARQRTNSTLDVSDPVKLFSPFDSQLHTASSIVVPSFSDRA